MTDTLRTVALACAMLAIGASNAAAQNATLKGDLLKDWNGLKDTMAKIASAMPEDKVGFKPTPPQRSYAEQILHVATVNMRLLRMLGANAPAPAINEKATSRADVIKAMTDSFDYGAAIINEQTDQSILGTIQAGFMGSSTRARVVWFLVGHTWDIYGQMAVYLRLNGVVPPASQRP